MDLLRSINDFATAIKKAGNSAVVASDPVYVLFGEVRNVSPLEISVEQRLTLEDEYLILTQAVRDYEVDMTIDSIRKKVTIHNGLKTGDKVKLLRVQGGQKFVVFDKE